MKELKEEERFWKRYLSIILMKKNKNYYIMNNTIHYNRIFIRYSLLYFNYIGGQRQ